MFVADEYDGELELNLLAADIWGKLSYLLHIQFCTRQFAYVHNEAVFSVEDLLFT